MSEEHPETNYVGIWIILSVAFGLSLVATAISASKVAVVFVFVIAVMKAFLVLSRFMHLSTEPRVIKVLVASSLLALLVLYLGLMPDIVWEGSRIEFVSLQTVEHGSPGQDEQDKHAGTLEDAK